jgi:UDP-N-acetylglucosamine kinase
MENNFTDYEFQLARNEVLAYLTDGKFPSEHTPMAHLIVGQPGAGKTTMAQYFMSQSPDTIIFISGDDFRQFHPHFKELQHDYGDNAVLYTQKFAGMMTEAMIDFTSDSGYDLIIEGTLRTTDVPLKTKNLLEKRGYDVSLAAIMVRPEISYLSTIKRYEMMKSLGLNPRKTPKEHHDMVVDGIVNNLNQLYEQKTFSNIQVFTRDSKIIYDMNETPEVNPSILFAKEFSRMLSRQEEEQIREEFSPYVPQNIINRTIQQNQTARGNQSWTR